MFPPGKPGREISGKIWGFEISRFSGNLCRDFGKFFYISKDFSGTDIYHCDIKNALMQILNLFFCLLNTIFQNSQNLLRRNACEIKIFSSIGRKIEKLKLSLSKRHNKMLKIRSEMLKIRKNGEIIKLGKITQEFPESQESRGFWGSREFPEIPGKFLKISSFPGS